MPNRSTLTWLVRPSTREIIAANGATLLEPRIMQVLVVTEALALCQAMGFARIAPFGDDPPRLLRHLVFRERRIA